MKYLEHLPKALLVLLFSKGLILGFDLSSCIVLGILALLIAFYEYKIKEDKIIEIDQELKRLNDRLLLNEEKTSKVNDSITGFKMAQGMKVKF